jgi:hypothetical protein
VAVPDTVAMLQAALGAVEVRLGADGYDPDPATPRC